ncbi:MAG TPA: endonuclease/exonuclease/phosphatase family protein [Candidatus Acidoferrales bacterium]|nr:endonuclease/exonuclease/phosphatase family protein [Candidatus Acidoferrales bacterium]
MGWGSLRRPYGLIRSAGPVYPPVTLAAVRSFRVATFNIHSGKGITGLKDLARTAEALRGVDLAGLNEVRGANLFSDDQATELGRRLGLAAVFGPSERRWYVTSFGNGLLSRFPILEWRSQPMRAGSRRSYRAMIVAGAQIDGRKVSVLVVHVESGKLRERQLREVADLFSTVEPPAILVGDFNARVSHPEIRRILRLNGARQADPVAPGAEKRIDHIFVRGLRIRASGTKQTDASDHPLVWAEVELSEARISRPAAALCYACFSG